MFASIQIIPYGHCGPLHQVVNVKLKKVKLKNNKLNHQKKKQPQIKKKRNEADYKSIL